MLPLQELNGRIDLMLIGPGTTGVEVDQACAIARQQRIRAVCVPGAWVERVAARLEESTIKTVALVDFPLGMAESDVKRFETEAAIDRGAQEIQFVLNTGSIREGDSRAVLRELRDLAEAAEERQVCAVLHTPLLTRDQILQTCGLILDSGVQVIAPGVVFSGIVPPGIEHAELLKEALGARFPVQGVVPASTIAAAKAWIEAGCDRIAVSDFDLWERANVS